MVVLPGLSASLGAVGKQIITFRYHRNCAVSRGVELGAPGELPEVLAWSFSPAWSVLAPTPGSTLHGPICDSVRTSVAL